MRNTPESHNAPTTAQSRPQTGPAEVITPKVDQPLGSFTDRRLALRHELGIQDYRLAQNRKAFEAALARPIYHLGSLLALRQLNRERKRLLVIRQAIADTLMAHYRAEQLAASTYTYSPAKAA